MTLASLCKAINKKPLMNDFFYFQSDMIRIKNCLRTILKKKISNLPQSHLLYPGPTVPG
jgi:hypothetical protein